MAAEKSKTIYNGDWNAWESATKGPIGKAKALQLIFPAIQGAGEAEEVVPRLQRPRTRMPWIVLQELRELQLCSTVLVGQPDRPRLPHL